MTILEALVKLRDDIKLWCTNNFNKKLNKNLGAEKSDKFLITNEDGNITTIAPPDVYELFGLNEVQIQLDTLDYAVNDKAEIFSSPTINADKKLTESGYYYIQLKYKGTGQVINPIMDGSGSKNLSAGVLYWDGENSVVHYIMDSDYRYKILISTIGNMFIYAHNIYRNETGIVALDATDNFDIYISKIGN